MLSQHVKAAVKLRRLVGKAKPSGLSRQAVGGEVSLRQHTRAIRVSERETHVKSEK